MQEERNISETERQNLMQEETNISETERDRI